jgi:DNA polymerase-3 subunit epsilon
MNFLVFDSETTGLPKRFNAPMDDVDNWPRMTQLAFQLIDHEGNELYQYQSLIKPDGWEVPKEKFFIENNMSTERCMDEGVPVFTALRELQEALKQAQYKVAHNIAFDRNIVGAEIIRANISLPLFKYKPEICTMKSTTNHVKIKTHAGGNKWPKLIELHEHLFGYVFDGAHDALADVRATSACLIKSIDLGYIKLK